MGAISKILKPILDKMRPLIGDDEIDKLEAELKKQEDERDVFIKDISTVESMLKEYDEINLEDDEDIWYGFGGWMTSIVEKLERFGLNGSLDATRGKFYVGEIRKLMENPPRVLHKMRLLMLQLKGDVLKW